MRPKPSDLKNWTRWRDRIYSCLSALNVTASRRVANLMGAKFEKRNYTRMTIAAEIANLHFSRAKKLDDFVEVLNRAIAGEVFGWDCEVVPARKEAQNAAL